MNNLNTYQGAVEPFGSSYGQKKMSSECLTLVRAKGRSKIYRLFKFLLQSTGKIDKSKGLCDVCGLWVLAGKVGTTSNLWVHLRTCHREEYAGLLAVNEVTTPISKALQSTGPLPRSLKRKLLPALIRMVALDFQPFTIVDDVGFRYLLSVIDPRLLAVLPARQTLRKALRTEAESVRDKVKEELGLCKGFLTIATDGWSSSTSEGYEALHAHYIDSKWNLVSRTLGADTSGCETTAAGLSAMLHNFLQDYDIEWKNVGAFVSDTASNIRAALRSMGRPALPCMAHILPLRKRLPVHRWPRNSWSSCGRW